MRDCVRDRLRHLGDGVRIETRRSTEDDAARRNGLEHTLDDQAVEVYVGIERRREGCAPRSDPTRLRRHQTGPARASPNDGRTPRRIMDRGFEADTTGQSHPCTDYECDAKRPILQRIGRSLAPRPFAWPRYAAQLLKHAARLGLVYITLHISRKKEPPLFEILGRLRNFLHVVVVIFVALFERMPRIAGS